MNTCKIGTLLAATVAAAIAGTASAQDAPATGGLDEVTVTAQRREQSLQDVPIAISAFSADQLTSRNIVDTYDLVRNVPNLTGNANVGVGTSSSLYIRGIGNAESIATFDVPVGTYVDDVYISRQNQNNFGMFDVERIEVLRGPQGTLFGRNTTGGAINIVMRKPGTEQKGYVEAGVGRFGLKQVRASVDMPLSDRFLTKISAYKVTDDGYATQLSTGIDFNDRDATGARIDLRFLPTDAVTADLVVEYIDDRNTNFLNLVAADDRRIINNRLVQGALVGAFTGAKAALRPGNEASTTAFTLNVKWDLSDALSLTSITGYRDTTHEFLVDSGGELPRLTTTRGFTPLANIGDHEQVSQEFKLNGMALSDTLTWVAGAYWLSEDNVTDFANANTVATTGVFSVAADRTMKNGLDTYAFYAQGDWQFADAWTATLGLRYTDEKKDFAIDRNPGATGVALSTAAIAAAGIPLELKEQVWTPRVALNYSLNEDVSFFVSATNGFKSGGWPARATANNAFIPFAPEKVWSYEAGMRSQLFDNTPARERDRVLLDHRRHPDPGAHRLQRRADLDHVEPRRHEELWRGDRRRVGADRQLHAGRGPRPPESGVHQHRVERARAGRGLPCQPGGAVPGRSGLQRELRRPVRQYRNPGPRAGLHGQPQRHLRPEARLGDDVAVARLELQRRVRDRHYRQPAEHQRHLVGLAGLHQCPACLRLREPAGSVGRGRLPQLRGQGLPDVGARPVPVPGSSGHLGRPRPLQVLS